MSLNVVRKLVVIGAIMSVSTMIAACASSNDADDSEVATSTGEDLKCASTVATKLAAAALKQNGQKSKERCYAYVKSEMNAAGISTSPVDAAGDGVGAYQFAVWAKKNPAGLKKMGLVQRNDLSLNALPKGAIMVWKQGQCGFSKQYGHIEIVVDDNSSKACSDFCWSFKKNCGKPDIFIPSSCGPSAAPVSGPDPSTQPIESDDDDDDSASTPLSPSSSSPSSSASSSSPSSGGTGCFSQTLGENVGEATCIDSDADGIWEQCHNGQWYRGVNSTATTGPYGACQTPESSTTADPTGDDDDDDDDDDIEDAHH